MNKLTLAALAFAALGFASASAQSVTITAGANDMILGLEESGVNTDLEVDLGAASLFTNMANITFSSQYLNATDLSNVFGSSWTSNVDWSVAARLTGADAFDVTSLTQTHNESASTQGAVATQTAALYGALNEATSTANSDFAVTVGNNTTPAAAGSVTVIPT